LNINFFIFDNSQRHPQLMTYKNYLILEADTRLDEHTVAAVCKRNIATADATLVVEQAAKISKLS